MNDSARGEQQRRRHLLVLLGDSDIERWPAHLYPFYVFPRNVEIVGRGGAQLRDVTEIYKNWALESAAIADNCVGELDIFIIACAGENDIGSGKSIEATMEDFSLLLAGIISEYNGEGRRKIIFLGPKFEPWLIRDHSSRKQYATLSKRMRRHCEKHVRCADITFVDCLTMFCGETKGVPGAALGGRAIPDKNYFAEDGLHLNDEGYNLWKEELNRLLHQL
uniref:SGNH hydrolase-type esterase domain-containing protein n=1 Tax=Leptocylindrus danicus TaxID=163516 RepID=A0A7S2KE40_9STRA|mmetsp:Transcript_21823/g.32668  ORF Transcript_21823/g.32668 Transcript_21823/m.32668 type:complete len:221 (+) Transcript_21823:180-842(+)